MSWQKLKEKTHSFRFACRFSVSFSTEASISNRGSGDDNDCVVVCCRDERDCRSFLFFLYGCNPTNLGHARFRKESFTKPPSVNAYSRNFQRFTLGDSNNKLIASALLDKSWEGRGGGVKDQAFGGSSFAFLLRRRNIGILLI